MKAWITGWRATRQPGHRRWWLWGMLAVALLAGAAIGAYQFTIKSVALEVDGRAVLVRTFAPDVAALLREQKVGLASPDRVEPGLNTPLASGLRVEVVRAVPVTVQVDGEERTILLAPPFAVQDVLKRTGVYVGEQDRVEPAPAAVLQEGTRIRVTRVWTKDYAQESELPYRVVRQEDPQLERGITHVVQKGEIGLAREVQRATFSDGQEVAREVVESRVLAEPRPEIVAHGTITVASRGGQSFRFKRAFYAVATAYHIPGGTTYTGSKVKVGTIAVDPGVVPLYSRLYVEGYGYGTALDTGGAIKGEKIDVYLDSREAALRWGVKRVKVYVLE